MNGFKFKKLIIWQHAMKFLGYSIRSLAEVVTCLYKAKNRKYIADNEFEEHYGFCFNLMNMLISFRNKV